MPTSEKQTARPRRWPRRVAVIFLSVATAAILLLAGFSCWVIHVTVPVVVVDGEGQPVGGVTVYGAENLGTTSADATKESKTWRDWTKSRMHRLTRPFGVALEWDMEQPVFTGGAGSARVPANSRLLTAISLGDLKPKPGEVYVAETTPGNRDRGTPARIVLRRSDQEPFAAEKRVTWLFVEAPLSDVLKDAEALIGVTIEVDRDSLMDEGVRLETPVTINLNNATVDSGLHLLLGMLNLSFVRGAASIRIASQNTDGDGSLEVRLYPVADLLADSADQMERDATALSELIMQAVQPSGWHSSYRHGKSFMFPHERALVFSHKPEFHIQVETLLSTIRNDGIEPESEVQHKIRRGLATEVSINAQDEPFSDVIDNLRDLTELNIVQDRLAMEEVRVRSDTSVTLRVHDMPLHEAMEQLLAPLDLTTIIEEDVLVVTSRARVRSAIAVRVYPIGKLLGDSGDGDHFCARIERAVAPSTWQNVGGQGWTQYFTPKRCLVVRQTNEVHSQIQAFLEKLSANSDNPTP